jgi:TrpR-related protein YerC/YecD
MTSGKVTSAEANPETAVDAMGQRLQVARLVNDGISYQEISRRTGASTATVTRVAQWLHHGEGGYPAVLKRSRR